LFEIATLARISSVASKPQRAEVRIKKSRERMVLPMPAKKKVIRDAGTEDERSVELKRDEQAALDELGDDPGQVGAESAGQSGSSQRLSPVEDANEESVEELADTDQAYEAAVVEGVEDAADHPERPVHTHLEYGRPDDLPPAPETDDEEAA
jgi:hypothetical protein